MVTVFRHMDVNVSMSALRRHVVNISGERRDLFPVPYSLCNKYILRTVLKYMYEFIFTVDFTNKFFIFKENSSIDSIAVL